MGVLYMVDFSPGALTGNRYAVGDYLNRVTAAGEPAGLADTVAAAVLQTDLGQYSSMLTQLGTEFYAEQQALALSGVQRFARNLQNCGTLSIGETAGDDTGCLWARYDNNPSSRESRAGFPAMSDESYSISSGVQVPRDGDWTPALGGKPSHLTLPWMPQAEAIAFAPDGLSLVIGSEQLPSPLLRYRVEP